MDRIANPDHAVNLAERMRQTALHVVAKKQRNWEGYWQIVQASLEPHGDTGDWRPVN